MKSPEVIGPIVRMVNSTVVSMQHTGTQTNLIRTRNTSRDHPWQWKPETELKKRTSSPLIFSEAKEKGSIRA